MTDSQYRRPGLGLFVFCLAALLLAPCGQTLSQQTDAPSEGSPVRQPQSQRDKVKELIRQAYTQSQTATTIAQYNQVLQFCDQAQGYDLSSANATYVKNLSAWIHNRRGEAFADQAARREQEGQVQEGRELEQLALADFEEALRLNPQAWRPRHNRAVSYAVAGRYEKAIEEFSHVIQNKPRYKNAWFNRGEIYYETGDFAGAVRDYTEAVRLDPSDAQARLGRGHARYQLGQFDGALEDYDKVVRLEPDSAAAVVDRADTYAQLGRWEEAARDYRVAIRLDTTFGRAYENAAWLMATCPDERFRNDQLALSAARRALELASQDNFRALDTLAAAQANAGQFEQAGATVRKAIQIAPEDQAAPLEARLALYEANKPFRESTAAPQQETPR